jgi:hypothetical protein
VGLPVRKIQYRSMIQVKSEIKAMLQYNVVRKYQVDPQFHEQLTHFHWNQSETHSSLALSMQPQDQSWCYHPENRVLRYIRLGNKIMYVPTENKV